MIKAIKILSFALTFKLQPGDSCCKPVFIFSSTVLSSGLVPRSQVWCAVTNFNHCASLFRENQAFKLSGNHGQHGDYYVLRLTTSYNSIYVTESTRKKTVGLKSISFSVVCCSGFLFFKNKQIGDNINGTSNITSNPRQQFTFTSENYARKGNYVIKKKIV